MRADNARFWEALRELLVEAGLRDLPQRLTFDRLPVPERLGPEVFFSQTFLPQFRDLGLGTELLRIADENGRKLGKRGMSVIVSDANIGARRDRKSVV